MTSIDVNAERPYTVQVAPGALAELPRLLGDAHRVAVIHAPVMAGQLDELEARVGRSVTAIEVPDAEGAKTAEVLERCWAALADAGFTRGDAVVGLGGGATTDLAGFVAATWLRGVPYVAVPTTVLAMVDAAVGGKTGINVAQGKNLVGAFYEPVGVIADLDLLATLPEVDVRAGLAEVVKAGFIADPEILRIVESAPTVAVDVGSSELAGLLTRAIAVKAAVVSADLRESTSVGTTVGRELLNYGHTLAHAIERRERYGWRHGDAVSVGMVFVAELSRQLGRLDDPTADRHRSTLELVGLPTRYDPAAWPELRDAMALDKKTRGATLRFVILEGLARAAILAGPPEEELAEAYRRASS